MGKIWINMVYLMNIHRLYDMGLSANRIQHFKRTNNEPAPTHLVWDKP